MKQVPILSGKGMIVELPEGATRIYPNITHGRLLWIENEAPCLTLPPGTWQIVGMLREVREDQAKEVVDAPVNVGLLDLYLNYKEKSHSAFTAIEPLESAILAEGYYLDESPIKRTQFTNPDIWDSIQSRVLSRERCLLLKEVSTSP